MIILFSKYLYSISYHDAVVAGTYSLTAKIGPLSDFLPVLSQCSDAGCRSSHLCMLGFEVVNAWPHSINIRPFHSP